MKPETIELRKKGVGGSEVAAILGLDDYSSPYKVWAYKTGRLDNFVGNKYTEAGVFLESAVSDFFEFKTKYRIFKNSAAEKTYFHPKYSFALGTPDRLYAASNSIGKGVLECKTTQMSFDDVPEKWFCQLQWYLGVLNSMYGSVAWLERGVDFKYKEYEFQPDFFNFMVEEVGQFWEKNVLKDIPPDPINVSDVLLRYPKHSEGKSILATPEVLEAYERLTIVRDTIKQQEVLKETLEDQIKLFMSDAEMISSGATTLATWKASKDSRKFNTDAFKSENPELYERYMIDVPGSRRFLLK